MYGWFYKILAAKRFRSQARLPFGLSRAFKELTFDRIEEAIEISQANFIKMTANFNLYKVLQNALNECYYGKDEFDYVTRYNDPIITPSQESRLRSLRSKIWFSLCAFFMVETMLYYMISENITGGIVSQIEGMGEDVAAYKGVFLFAASAFFALVTAFCLDGGLRLIFYFFKAKKHYDNKFIDIAAYRSALVKFYFGLSMVAGTFIVLVLLNWARAFAIDGGASDINGNDVDSSHNPILMYGLIALSVLTGIAFGIAKKELAENSELISLANKWHKLKAEMAVAHNTITELSIRIQNQFSLVINKAHCLGVDLQELMEREYDERDQELAAQFHAEVRNGKFYSTHADGHTSFTISATDAHYYQNLITNEAFLHRNYFTTHERLSAIMNDANRMVTTVNRMEDERLTKLTKQSEKSAEVQVPQSANNILSVNKAQVSAIQNDQPIEDLNSSTLNNNHSLNGKHLTTH